MIGLPYQLLAAGVVLGGAWLYHLSEVNSADTAGYERAQNEYRAKETVALREALADRDRLAKELQEVSRDAREKTLALDAAQRDSADVGRRLRDAADALRRRSACPVGAPAGSPPADAADRVLADVHRRLDEAQERVARFADEAHIAGLACERAVDAVK
jgi:hypothetical protein